MGGAPSWASLRQHSRQVGIPLGLTYGMTETASQIATLSPSGFWAGEEDYLPLLPHAQVQIVPVPGQSDGVGQIEIQAQSLAKGYYPQLWDPSAPLLTDDLGQVNSAGDLRILGRRQELIISGGEKILAPEVEAELQALPGILDVCVVGIPDAEWGERVAAVYVPQPESTDLDSLDPEQFSQALKSQLQERLHPAKIPKTWHRVAQLPRNSQGKLNRDQIRQLLSGQWAPSRYRDKK
ncbi:MAG: AMP-binding protein [Synechococcaceae cyanobacterium RM1_1_27]|nr:AMP-binding protein [Synechococcaceae cyanobacterium RM1_1_27]